jgi:hypothetical protein
MIFNKLNITGFNKAFRSTKWGKERFEDDLSFFYPIKERKAMLEYGRFIGVTEIFKNYSAGVETIRDKITIHHNMNNLMEVLKDFSELSEKDICYKYKTQDSRDWKVSRSKKDIENNIKDKNSFQKINYRPFDSRHTFYTGKQNGFVCNPRFAVMQHMLKGDNVGLVFCRQISIEDWQHCFITNEIMERCLVSNKGKECGYLAPLYLYE